MFSPSKKKSRKGTNSNSDSLKRQNETSEIPVKRLKVIKTKEDELLALKRKNFVTACEQVSCKSYFDHHSRLMLLYLPMCLNKSTCKHHDPKNIVISAMPPRAEELFKVDLSTNMWLEALEVCQLSITPTQYLSAYSMKEVVEIMLNAHEDQYADFSIVELLQKCQQILSLNFSTHPPCLTKSLRKCYNDFLHSPMDLRDKTFSNRTQFGYDKGIVKYCMNRLEYELSSESKDDPLVDKYENIPEEMRGSVKGLHWQKEKFEIYEMLERTERIDRLMLVLETIIELLQFDLAIWHSRYTQNLGSHIMRSHKPLMAFTLWSNQVLYTGAVTNNCRQILKLFAYFIHLQYPERYINILTTWLNAVVQTFYICENNSNSDYPNTGKYCWVFASEFYKIILDLPHESIIRILERIRPSYMRHLVGILHVKAILVTEETCIVRNIIEFTKHLRWQKYEELYYEIKVFNSVISQKKKLHHLLKKIDLTTEDAAETNTCCKFNFNSRFEKFDPNRNTVIHCLYITLEAYLSAFNLQNVQDTLNTLNDNLLKSKDPSDSSQQQVHSYSVTEILVKKYRNIFKLLKELVFLLQEMKKDGQLPASYKVFEEIGLIELS